MTDELPKPHVRRPRYRGTHPRGFTQKYKEQNPERYAEDVAKVLSSGKTPAGMHRPILVGEILEVLAPVPGDFAVDATLGYGGHATALLQAVLPGGRLLGLDVDPIELPKTESRLRSHAGTESALIVRRSNFAGLPRVLDEEGLPAADVLLADLGLSSMQIDDPARGRVEPALPVPRRDPPGEAAAEEAVAAARVAAAHIRSRSAVPRIEASSSSTGCAAGSGRPARRSPALTCSRQPGFALV